MMRVFFYIIYVSFKHGPHGPWKFKYTTQDLIDGSGGAGMNSKCGMPMCSIVSFSLYVFIYQGDADASNYSHHLYTRDDD